MSNVFGVHQQMNFTIHRDSKFGCDDVVFGILIVSGIESKEILVRLIDLVGVEGTEFSVGTGIAEIESELARLHLDRNRVGGGRREGDVSPSLGPEGSEGQN